MDPGAMQRGGVGPVEDARAAKPLGVRYERVGELMALLRQAEKQCSKLRRRDFRRRGPESALGIPAGLNQTIEDRPFAMFCHDILPVRVMPDRQRL
jgi:hypothetical protein